MKTRSDFIRDYQDTAYDFHASETGTEYSYRESLPDGWHIEARPIFTPSGVRAHMTLWHWGAGVQMVPGEGIETINKLTKATPLSSWFGKEIPEQIMTRLNVVERYMQLWADNANGWPSQSGDIP